MFKSRGINDYSLFTILKDHYEPYKDYNQDEYTWPIFDQNSQLITNRKTRYSIFIKIKD